jgi:YegS/Rv2252/BmrU family lipid kinase
MMVYNPTAGRYPSWLLTERAADVLRSHGWTIELQQTHSAEHISQLAGQAAQDHLDAIFIVGGDGSINFAINELVGTETALGVLPAGTANVWAQELGLPGLNWTRWMALEESARRLATAAPRVIEVGRCNDRYFLLWAGVGLDGFIVHRIEPREQWKKRLAVVHYSASVLWNASLWRGVNLNVTADGVSIKGRFILGVVSNIRLYAGGYVELSPDARLDDGKMDLWLFKGETLGDMVQLAWELFSGNYQRSDQVEHLAFRSLQLRSDSPLFVQLDGEPVKVQDGIDIEVVPRALKVLVPETTPRPLFQIPG